MSTVRWSSWPIATARLKAIVVLPTPPFGAKTEMIRVAPPALDGLERLADVVDDVDEVEARERHREDAVDAVLGVRIERVLGHGQDDHGDAELGLVDLVDEVRPLDPSLEQRIDQDDVRSELLDVRQRLRAVGQDVEKLDLGLRVQQATDVLRDLRHVLDDEQAGLIARCHPSDDTMWPSRGTSHPEVLPTTPDRLLPDRDQDRSFAARPERAELVVRRPAPRRRAPLPRRTRRSSAADRRRITSRRTQRRTGPPGAPASKMSSHDRPGRRVVLGRADLGHDLAGLRVVAAATRG